MYGSIEAKKAAFRGREADFHAGGVDLYPAGFPDFA